MARKPGARTPGTRIPAEFDGDQMVWAAWLLHLQSVRKALALVDWTVRIRASMEISARSATAAGGGAIS